MNKKKGAQPKPTKKRSILLEYLESFIIALILALFIKYSIVEAYKIPSGSMEDTLLVGDFLLANKFIYGSRLPIIGVRLPALAQPKSGDIIIFKYPLNPKVNYIKRCVAIEGQVVEMRDKVLYVDGKRVQDPPEGKHEDLDILEGRDNFAPIRIPKGYIFMMGDNRDRSYDSRFWGPLDKKLVLGRAMVIHWSWAPDERAPVPALYRPLSIPSWLFYNIAHFPQRVRWNRIGHIIR
ncbi:MAG: signal peptidase I [candidate division Zixibacteria bacterium]|nr:signal peptidase I [candidate division Zixibacteria bacterium]